MRTLICGNGVDVLLFQSNGGYKVFFFGNFFFGDNKNASNGSLMRVVKF